MEFVTDKIRDEHGIVANWTSDCDTQCSDSFTIASIVGVKECAQDSEQCR